MRLHLFSTRPTIKVVQVSSIAGVHQVEPTPMLGTNEIEAASNYCREVPANDGDHRPDDDCAICVGRTMRVETFLAWVASCGSFVLLDEESCVASGELAGHSITK